MKYLTFHFADKKIFKNREQEPLFRKTVLANLTVEKAVQNYLTMFVSFLTFCNTSYSRSS